MTHRIGAKGQVVIPKDVRDRTGLHPGTEVDVSLEGQRVIVSPHRLKRPLGGRFNRSGMAAALLDDRATEPR
jgi:AbrB family looped-hinge helix DNA binding protein